MYAPVSRAFFRLRAAPTEEDRHGSGPGERIERAPRGMREFHGLRVKEISKCGGGWEAGPRWGVKNTPARGHESGALTPSWKG
jgi:hypothetical protein